VLACDAPCCRRAACRCATATLPLPLRTAAAPHTCISLSATAHTVVLFPDGMSFAGSRCRCCVTSHCVIAVLRCCLLDAVHGAAYTRRLGEILPGAPAYALPHAFHYDAAGILLPWLCAAPRHNRAFYGRTTGCGACVCSVCWRRGCLFGTGCWRMPIPCSLFYPALATFYSLLKRHSFAARYFLRDIGTLPAGRPSEGSDQKRKTGQGKW